MDKSERFAIAALLRHNSMVGLAMYHCNNPSADSEEDLVPLWRTGYKIRKWIIQERQATQTRFTQRLFIHH